MEPGGTRGKLRPSQLVSPRLHTGHVIQPTLTAQNSSTGMEGTDFFCENAHVHSQTKFADFIGIGRH